MEVVPANDVQGFGSARAQRNLQAIILAAGFARRMQPLSDNCHKGLLSVAGSTILGRIMDNLQQIGVRRVTVVTGYRSDDIESFLRTGYPDVDLRLVHNPRYRDTNNVVSLSLAYDDLTFDADIVQIECDLLFDPSVLERLVAHPGKNVALVDEYRTGMDGTVVEVSGGFVTHVYTSDTQGTDFSFVDKYKTLKIYRFDRDFAEHALRPMLHTYANDIDANCFYELVLGMLTSIDANRISAEVVTGDRWSEVDDPNDLALTPFQFEPARRSEILDGPSRGHWNFDIRDFSLTRNVHFPTGAMLATLRHALPDLVANYCSDQDIINEKLGYFLQCSSRRLQVLHGASQAFPLLGQHLSDRRALVPSATNDEYQRTFPDAEVFVDLPGVDWNQLSTRAGQFGVVVITNPNATTGTTIPGEDLYALASSNPATTFWIDESFIAFSAASSLISLLERDPLTNVVVLVSLSSTLGVPGLRLGYVYSCDLSLIDAVGRALPHWNLSAPAEFYLELLIKFRPSYARSLIQTMADRDLLRTNLLKVRLIKDIPASGGNFLLVNLTGDDTTLARRLRDWLLEHCCIEVKEVSERFADRTPRLRVAVRSAADNELLVSAIRQFCDAGPDH